MSGFEHKTILLIKSSYRKNNSKSNELVDKVSEHYRKKYNVTLINRSLANDDNLSFLNEEWITANLEQEKSDEHKKILEFSDTLISEINSADIIIFGCPMYNFGVSSSLKSYIDLVCRSGITFQYTESGTVGLVKNKKAIICTTSSAVPSNCPVDFVYGYMRQFCNFIGIEDCTLVNSNEILKNGNDWLKNTESQITNL